MKVSNVHFIHPNEHGNDIKKKWQQYNIAHQPHFAYIRRLQEKTDVLLPLWKFRKSETKAVDSSHRLSDIVVCYAGLRKI